MNRTASLSTEVVELPLDTGGTIKGQILSKAFFDKPAPMVAWDILGKVLVHETSKGIVAGKIVETEAYLGGKDPACHASAGDTRRNEIFRSEPGTVYVFSSFGIYNCVNVLTSGEQPSGCVLLRAVEPLVGLSIMGKNRGSVESKNLTSGPGKLADAFDISRDHNRHMITNRPLMIADFGFNSFVPAMDVRVGITKAAHYPLRYLIPNNPYVSKPNRKLFSVAA
jgi:DNA-3-methyladenine glycosylase